MNSVQQKGLLKDRIKRKNNFYKYVDKAVSGLENMEKIVAMVESKSLDNFISEYF